MKSFFLLTVCLLALKVFNLNAQTKITILSEIILGDGTENKNSNLSYSEITEKFETGLYFEDEGGNEVIRKIDGKIYSKESYYDRKRVELRMIIDSSEIRGSKIFVILKPKFNKKIGYKICVNKAELISEGLNVYMNQKKPFPPTDFEKINTATYKALNPFIIHFPEVIALDLINGKLQSLINKLNYDSPQLVSEYSNTYDLINSFAYSERGKLETKLSNTQKKNLKVLGENDSTIISWTNSIEYLDDYNFSIQVIRKYDSLLVELQVKSKQLIPYFLHVLETQPMQNKSNYAFKRGKILFNSNFFRTARISLCFTLNTSISKQNLVSLEDTIVKFSRARIISPYLGIGGDVKVLTLNRLTDIRAYCSVGYNIINAKFIEYPINFGIGIGSGNLVFNISYGILSTIIPKQSFVINYKDLPYTPPGSSNPITQINYKDSNLFSRKFVSVIGLGFSYKIF